MALTYGVLKSSAAYDPTPLTGSVALNELMKLNSIDGLRSKVIPHIP